MREGVIVKLAVELMLKDGRKLSVSDVGQLCVEEIESICNGERESEKDLVTEARDFEREIVFDFDVVFDSFGVIVLVQANSKWMSLMLSDNWLGYRIIRSNDICN